MKGAADTTAIRIALLDELKKLELPDGGTLASQDMVRALSIAGATARFVIKAPLPAVAQQMAPPSRCRGWITTAWHLRRLIAVNQHSASLDGKNIKSRTTRRLWMLA